MPIVSFNDDEFRREGKAVKEVCLTFCGLKLYRAVYTSTSSSAVKSLGEVDDDGNVETKKPTVIAGFSNNINN